MTRRIVEKLPGIDRGEGGPALLCAAYFFFVLVGFFLLRPLREAMGLDSGVDRLRWLYLGTLLGTVVANVLYGWLVSRSARRVFVPMVYHAAAAGMLVFLVLMLSATEPMRRAVGSAFYIWFSVFNVLGVAVFWGLMADTFTLAQGKRLFGLIGVGGTLGAIAGSAVVRAFGSSMSDVVQLVIGVALLEIAALLAVRVVALRADLRHEPLRGRTAEIGGSAWSGITHVARSPYLLGIVLYVLVFTVGSTLLYFEKMTIVDRLIDDRGQRKEFFAGIELWAQSLTVVLQVVLAGRLMRGLGVGVVMAVVPLVTIAGFTSLALWPTLGVLAAFEIVRRGCRHGLSKPASETLYTVVSSEDRYKAKSLIDTFIYRGGDTLGTLANLALARLALVGAAVAVPLAVAGAGVALWLGRVERRRGASVQGSEPGR